MNATKKRKVLFIDRDGTIIKEPADEQIDAFEKLSFYPGVFTYLGKIARELTYELVMVTNQDGLGTDGFPEDTFWPVQDFIMETIGNEGIHFSNVLIDKTYPHEKAATRKPATGLLTAYFDEAYDLTASYVIGDRMTDMELAKNLGAKGIFLKGESELGNDEITVAQELLAPHIALETSYLGSHLSISFNGRPCCHLSTEYQGNSNCYSVEPGWYRCFPYFDRISLL